METDILSYVWWVLLFKLVFTHYLFDYPLQGPFLSEAKNHMLEKNRDWWGQALFAHAFLHAGAVYFITNSLLLAMAELFCHAVIDYRKCSGKLTYNEDQLFHLACKVWWCSIAIQWHPL